MIFAINQIQTMRNYGENSFKNSLIWLFFEKSFCFSYRQSTDTAKKILRIT